MSKKLNEWVVFSEEKANRKWVDMPPESSIIGQPLFEHATDYISLLEDGTRVMIRKSDSYIFTNLATVVMSDEARDKVLEKIVSERDKRKRLSNTVNSSKYGTLVGY